MDAIDKLIMMLYKDARTRYAEETGEMLLNRIQSTINDLYTIGDCSDDEQVERFMSIVREHIRTEPKDMNYDLLGELLELQYQYYRRSGDTNKKYLNLYWSMASDPKGYYELFIKQGCETSIKLSFTLNLLAPKQQSLNELELFTDSVKILLSYFADSELSNDNVKVPGVTPFIVFSKDIAGSKKSWINKIANWKKSLKVYDWYSLNELSKTEITKKLGIYNEDDNSNPLKEVRLILAEADRLVQSAKDGSFPL